MPPAPLSAALLLGPLSMPLETKMLDYAAVLPDKNMIDILLPVLPFRIHGQPNCFWHEVTLNQRKPFVEQLTNELK